MIPDLTRAVGVPRLAGISYPMGQPLGRPHDSAGQRAVLHAMLELLASASGPDTYVELPFEWPESPAKSQRFQWDVCAAAHRRSVEGEWPHLLQQPDPER